jgi:hypothetical protein
VRPSRDARGFGATGLEPGGGESSFSLDRIGRAVGNPLQPLLASWLLVLAACLCLGVARIARRRAE